MGVETYSNRMYIISGGEKNERVSYFFLIEFTFSKDSYMQMWECQYYLFIIKMDFFLCIQEHAFYSCFLLHLGGYLQFHHPPAYLSFMVHLKHHFIPAEVLDLY